MDYLRNLGSAAVSSLVQKSGLTLPFSLGQKVISYENKSIWTLYDATKRDDSSPVSVFEFDSGLPRNRNCFSLAKNALRKLRTIRHPDVLKFLDAVETDTTIYIMTERVRPLASAIQERISNTAKEREDWLLWGLHRIAVSLAFINDACSSTHGNVRVDSIFISPSGEWKLGGFEALSNPKDEAAVLYSMGGTIPDSMTHAPPEVKKGGWVALKEQSLSSADAYALGLLIHFSFNPSQPLPATSQPPHPPPTQQSRGSIPMSLFSAFKKLLNPNAKARLTPKDFLELGMATTVGEGSGFFSSNKLVKVCAGLDNFNLGSEAEKATLLRMLKESAASLPAEFASYRVLPALVSALDFGGASAGSILPLVLQFGKSVPPQDYPAVILVHLVKLFSNTDRGTRMALLEHLSEYSDKLDKKTVVEKVWPNLQTGFTDTVPVIREATVKSIILLSEKFNERILNNDLLRHLARMQADPEASIRTNTCILIGRLGPSLGYNTKRKVLVPAFTKALKDPFVHCRVAGLMAIMATVDCFDIEDLATRVIPSVSGSMIDPEKLVRDQAFKAVQIFAKKLEDHAATMPETTITTPGGGSSNAIAQVAGSTALATTAAGAASALAGWAITSLGKSLAATDLQSTITSVGAVLDRSASAPPAQPSSNGLAGFHSPASAYSIPDNVSTAPELNKKGKGMQLGADKLINSANTRDQAMGWAREAAAESGGSEGRTWGDDDLMDVNADQDDWSAFESAPPAPVVGLRSSHLPTFSDWGESLGDTQNEVTSEASPRVAFAQTKATSFGMRVSQVESSPMLAERPTSAQSATPSASGRSDPIPSRGASPAQTPTTSAAGVTKEEKAAEMARRKEERKQRIAALKEQKKSAVTKP